MNIPLLIAIASMIVWIFPPFCNKNSGYLFFFIIMAVSDPLGLLLLYTLKLNPIQLSTSVALLLLSALVTTSKYRNVLIGISIISAISFIVLNVSRSVLLGLLCGFHIMIVYLIVNSFIRHFYETHSVNLFLSLLIVYEFITILKYIAGILSYEQGAISFYLATFIQIFFGVLFSFITINTKDFSIMSDS